MSNQQKFNQQVLASLLAASIGLSVTIPAFALPNSINSVNNTNRPDPGTYLNTAGNSTTFNGNNGMVVNGNFRGLEVSGNGQTTGNGGNFRFNDPNFIVYDHANINLNALVDGNGRFTGNGGSISVTSPLVFMNGSAISLNGNSGGSFVANTGAFFSKDSSISATGTDGAGGIIKINSSGPVDVDEGSLFDVSGKTIGSYDTNVIDITGSAVNVDGILKADTTMGNGGRVMLTATGSNGEPQRVCIDCGIDRANRLGALDDASASRYHQVNAMLHQLDGDVIIGGPAQVSANGASGVAVSNDGRFNKAGDGGTIIVNAIHDIDINGRLTANGGQGNGHAILSGGDGGTISLNAGRKVTIENNAAVIASGGSGINNFYSIASNDPSNMQYLGLTGQPGISINQNTGVTTAVFSAGGNGGNGGVIAISAPTINNSGRIVADGGNGGNGSAAGAFARDTQTLNNANATTNAIAANGADGGNGGIILFNSQNNPNNTGLISAAGGNGGNGGDAKALSIATSTYGDAYASANAVAGNGGNGGYGGTVVVKNPSAMPGTIRVNGGTGGQAGYADAEANAYGYNNGIAISNAQGNILSPANSSRANSQASYNPVGAVTNATFSPASNGANRGNGNIDALRPVEMVYNNGKTILLNNGVTGNTDVTSLVAQANTRTLNNQLGGGTIPFGATQSFVVGDVASSQLTVTPGSISTPLPGNSNVMINANGKLINQDNITNQTTTFLSQGDFTNAGQVTTGQSVAVGSRGNVLNTGTLSAANTTQGGSVIINTTGNLRNSGLITADGLRYGGAVQITANDIQNDNGGRISADAQTPTIASTENATAGMVFLIGNHINNAGRISAQQSAQGVSQGGNGGNIFIKADNAFTNTETGVVTASGTNLGGNIIIGVSNVSGNEGVLTNNGIIRADGAQNGKITLVAEDSLRFGAGAQVGNLPYNTATILKNFMDTTADNGGTIIRAAGTGLVKQILCLDIPPTNTPPNQPVNPGQTLPLQRDAFDTNVNGNVNTNTLTVGDANLFLASGMQAVTAHVLDNAYIVFETALRESGNMATAYQQAVNFLMAAGMSPEVARELNKRLCCGKLNLHTNVEEARMADVLQVIGGVDQPEPTERLVQ